MNLARSAMIALAAPSPALTIGAAGMVLILVLLTMLDQAFPNKG